MTTHNAAALSVIFFLFGLVLALGHADDTTPDDGVDGGVDGDLPTDTATQELPC